MIGSVEIRKSINGKGIFAKSKFKKGQKVIEIKGRKTRYSSFTKLSKKERDNAFRFNSELYLIPNNEFGDYLNHSCNPNTLIKKKGGKLFLFAITNISKNSEITIDYSTILARDDYWEMKCNCKNKNCRKIIRRFNLLPKEILKKYLGSSIIPEFILKIKGIYSK